MNIAKSLSYLLCIAHNWNLALDLPECKTKINLFFSCKEDFARAKLRLRFAIYQFINTHEEFMSLELALQENTAALKHLAVLIATASGVGAVTQATQATVDTPAPKATRGKKADAVAAPLNADLPLASAVHLYPPNDGDPVGTRYFHIPAHNTVYKQLPGEQDCTLPSATIVTGTEYLVQKAELEKKFATAAAVATAKAEAASLAQAVVAQTAATVPSATAPAATASTGKSFEDVVNKARELHKAQGNAGLKRVLDQYGAAGVQALNGKASNEDLIANIDSILMGM